MEVYLHNKMNDLIELILDKNMKTLAKSRALTAWLVDVQKMVNTQSVFYTPRQEEGE